MSIKISGTTVIDDSRNLTNINNASFTSQLTVGGGSLSSSDSLELDYMFNANYKMYIRYDMTTNPITVNDSYNVSSLTDINTGLSAKFFTNNMNTNDFFVGGMSRNTRIIQTTNTTTNGVVNVLRLYANLNSYDEDFQNVAVSGELA